MAVKLGRVLTAMVTPFGPGGEVDYEAAENLAKHLVNNGSDGVVVSGTTGESPTLTQKEKLELFRRVKEAVGTAGTVVAGTGNNCTGDSVELTREAEKTGVDACMLVTPYYNKPPQEGLYLHFKSVAESTTLPVILYNVPSRTGLNISAQTVVALAEVENIVAVKDAGGDFGQISEIVKSTPAGFEVFSGQDEWTLPILALGGVGVISVASHVAGPQIREMVEAFEAGSLTRARTLHEQLLPLFRALFITTNPIMVKAAMQIMGHRVGSPRLPLVPATEEQIGVLRRRMEELETQ